MCLRTGGTLSEPCPKLLQPHMVEGPSPRHELRHRRLRQKVVVMMVDASHFTPAKSGRRSIVSLAVSALYIFVTYVLATWLRQDFGMTRLR
jgi:hypothetical protein